MPPQQAGHLHINPRPQHQMADAARTSRLTENKRRYRARQKEYVADLERRLADARAQGISATTQVQLAARKVAAENRRLRELLRLAGFDDGEVDLWAQGEGCHGTKQEGTAEGTDSASARRREIEQKARVCAEASAAGCNGLAGQGRRKACKSRQTKEEMGAAGTLNTPASTASPSNTHEPAVDDVAASPASPGSGTETAVLPAPTPGEIPSASATAPVDTSCASPGGGPRVGPCRLLSLLAENPAADIAQVTVRPPSGGDSLQGMAAYSGGDVECGKAYEMLMRYATSEEKMDYVARALEAGCTPTGPGACAVKKKAIWEALDGMCG
ncbi:hypothetical protein C8A05DRAFT_47568 [Staphylotrichum tortipilum]|uniref:BZIP domain-containing protein n=1 Tax=Staphylotrichum tortipilum TaxID=2831512 RepID=A0AAN6RQ35_9PEZI|nr:hypothetical protein C8A05DRAFT_47568 [Staphylotrichum longicolle]